MPYTLSHHYDRSPLLYLPFFVDYYRGAHGIALVYDVTTEASFQNIRKWIQDVQTYAEQSVNIVLIGNKCDLQNKKLVDKARGQLLADEFDIKFFETSAKDNINVEDAFTNLVHDVCERMFSPNADSNPVQPNPVDLDDVQPQGKKGCC
jgi:Ras-related protein Rab-8A